MAVSFTNNWKNILDKLEYTIRNEFKGALPVYRGSQVPAGTTYLQLNPVGSELLEYNVNFVFDKTKQDGAPIKILGNKLFKKYFPNFKFTKTSEGIKNTINYYKKHI